MLNENGPVNLLHRQYTDGLVKTLVLFTMEKFGKILVQETIETYLISQ